MKLRPVSVVAPDLLCVGCHRRHEPNQTAVNIDHTDFTEYYGGHCLRQLLERRCAENTGRKSVLPNGLIEYFVDGFRWTWQQEFPGPYQATRNDGGWQLQGASEFR